MKKLLLAATAALITLVTSCEPAYAQTDAGPVTRTFSAYDLTQCVCVVTSNNQFANVQSAPLVTVTSYYDGTVSSLTNTYQRVDSVNSYLLGGYYDGNQVMAYQGHVAYVLCYTTFPSGTKVDKVMSSTYVNNNTARPYIFYIPDQYIAEYVISSGHHC